MVSGKVMREFPLRNRHAVIMCQGRISQNQLNTDGYKLNAVKVIEAGNGAERDPRDG